MCDTERLAAAKDEYANMLFWQSKADLVKRVIEMTPDNNLLEFLDGYEAGGE